MEGEKKGNFLCGQLLKSPATRRLWKQRKEDNLNGTRARSHSSHYVIPQLDNSLLK